MPTPNNQLGLAGIPPQLPYGTHKIKWTITDGCGNETYCEYTFVVKDCKAPTLYVSTVGHEHYADADGTVVGYGLPAV